MTGRNSEPVMGAQDTDELLIKTFSPRRSAPAIQITTDEHGQNPVALNGGRSLLNRGAFVMIEGAEKTEGEPVEEIVRLARELVAKIGALRGAAKMGMVMISSSPSEARPDELRIEATQPIAHPKEESGEV